MKMDYDTGKSLTLQLRNAAMIERDTKVKGRMLAAADQITKAIHLFKAHPDGESLSDLQGLWSNGIRILNSATDPNMIPGGQAGTGTIEMEAMAA